MKLPIHGARFAYVFGSALLFTFILQTITGIALATTYSPSVTDAWGSVYYIQHHMTMGALVRAVHHYGSSAMIILCVLHMSQVLFYGAHKKPREANWILGVLMLLIILGFGLTGYLLPWDQKGYWATKVATGIMGGVPGGEGLQELLQGGSFYGNSTMRQQADALHCSGWSNLLISATTLAHCAQICSGVSGITGSISSSVQGSPALALVHNSHSRTPLPTPYCIMSTRSSSVTW